MVTVRIDGTIHGDMNECGDYGDCGGDTGVCFLVSCKLIAIYFAIFAIGSSYYLVVGGRWRSLRGWVTPQQLGGMPARW